MSSFHCKDCERLTYRGSGEYYCDFYDTTININPNNSACNGFEPVSGIEEIEKREEEKRDDYNWWH